MKNFKECCSVNLENSQKEKGWCEMWLIIDGYNVVFYFLREFFGIDPWLKMEEGEIKRKIQPGLLRKGREELVEKVVELRNHNIPKLVRNKVLLQFLV
ncbi:MAG: hypothetical protein QMC93_02500 [Patescibacteria group bacterium]|nr:hypothetical protein [Patescibacteria group bacterium]